MSAPIVIVGATGAIGSALARRVAARGVALHLIARDPDRLAALAQELGATHTAADALDTAALTAAVQAAGAEIGGLAYCVGSIRVEPLSRARPDDFVQAFQLNAVGAAMAVAAAARGLKAVPGSGVVLFSTVAVRSGFPGHAVIAAAKGAVEGLTLALAAELAPVRVNCIAPSLTRSTMSGPILANPAMEKALAQAHPIPRLGEGDDAGALADFLLSPSAGWITGQIMGVDGGRSSLRTRG
jgi:NAD(P)-dependent dehydrogenase (short-subunit alcohol dehydrogenase family)